MSDPTLSDQATSTPAPSTTTAMLESTSTLDASTIQTIVDESSSQSGATASDNANPSPAPPARTAVTSPPPLTLSHTEPARPVSASPANYAPPTPRAPLASTSHQTNGLRAPLMGNSSTPIPPSLQARLAAVRFSPSVCEIVRSITYCRRLHLENNPSSRTLLLTDGSPDLNSLHITPLSWCSYVHDFKYLDGVQRLKTPDGFSTIATSQLARPSLSIEQWSSTRPSWRNGNACYVGPNGKYESIQRRS